MKISKVACTLVSLFVISTGSYAQQPAQEAPPALVEVGQVKSEMIAQQVWVPGTVLSQTDSELASEVAGRIIWMAEVGAEVKQGERLVKLDDQRLRIALGQEQANIAKWEARVTMLDKRIKRFSTMAAKQNTSRDQLDEIASELEIARQELNQAKLTYDMTAYQLQQSEVVAPFDALVVERIQSPGEYTSIGQNLIRVVDPTNVEASVRAPLSVIPFIERGMSVTVKDKVHSKGEAIKTIVPVGNQNSRMMELRIALEPGDFAIGSAVRVALPHSETHQGTTVPRDALVLRKSGVYVYQVDDNMEARQVMVETGIGIGSRIEVFGDLTKQGVVVVRGAERLRPGQKVTYSGDQDSFTARN